MVFETSSRRLDAGRGAPQTIRGLIMSGWLCTFVTAFAALLTWHPAAADAVNIVSVSDNLCAGVAGGSTAKGAPVVQMNCDGAPDTAWTFEPLGNGYYHVRLQSSGQCLNVYGNSRAIGTPLIQWNCESVSVYNDQWSIVVIGGNSHLVSHSSGLCMNVPGVSTAVGKQFIQWHCEGAAVLNDQFKLVSSTAVQPSTWSPVIALPVNPIGLAHLPNGKLVMWSSNQPYTYQGDVGYTMTQTYYAVFDPATNTATQAIETSAGSDMFCPGTAMLADGQLLVNGGDSSPETSLYNWTSDTWTAAATMNIPRGYEGTALLSNGSVFTLGGSWSGGSGNKTGEVWNPNAGWTMLTGVPETNVIGPDPQDAKLGHLYRGDNHLWLFAQANGTVFHAGPSAQMNWITTDGIGTIQSAGNRGSDPYSINGNAVLYDVGKVLKVGGAPAYQQNFSAPTFATNSAYVIDISGGPGQPVAVQQLAGMNYYRAFSNAVVLPSGQVVVVGGQTIPQPFTDTSAVLTAELWDPVTGAFTLLEPMQTPRTYHSTALLLPDGRVFVGGGGQCGNGCAQNHLDAEILTPPYLLNADGTAATRPVIQSAPASGQRGNAIAVTTDAPVSSFALIRLSAVTHTTNNDQRRIPLMTTTTGASSYSLAIPADPGIALPGYYMLFAIDANGVPSVASTIQIP
jgi:hypothetical protein